MKMLRKIRRAIAKKFKNWKGAKETDMEKPKTSDTIAIHLRIINRLLTIYKHNKGLTLSA